MPQNRSLLAPGRHRPRRTPEAQLSTVNASYRSSNLPAHSKKARLCASKPAPACPSSPVPGQPGGRCRCGCGLARKPGVLRRQRTVLGNQLLDPVSTSHIASTTDRARSVVNGRALRARYRLNSYGVPWGLAGAEQEEA
jgi:hypothetical protein